MSISHNSGTLKQFSFLLTKKKRRAKDKRGKAMPGWSRRVSKGKREQKNANSDLIRNRRCGILGVLVGHETDKKGEIRLKMG